jgi:hypothetical protein
LFVVGQTAKTEAARLAQQVSNTFDLSNKFVLGNSGVPIIQFKRENSG